MRMLPTPVLIYWVVWNGFIFLTGNFFFFFFFFLGKWFEKLDSFSNGIFGMGVRGKVM